MSLLHDVKAIPIIKLYRFSVFFVLVLIISNIVLAFQMISQKRGDAKVINLAGQQRMLSQKISRHFFELHLTTPSERLRVIQNLNTELKIWADVHKILQNGSDTLEIPPCDKDIAKSLHNMEKQLYSITDSIINQQLFRVTPNQIATISREVDIFLNGMGQIVKTLEVRADERLDKIYYSELILILSFLLILFIEYHFVFKKMFTHNKKQYNTILEENKKLKEIAHIQSHKVRKPVASILGVVSLIDKNECGEEQAELIEALEIATSELDLIIHEIVGKTIPSSDTNFNDYH